MRIAGKALVASLALLAGVATYQVTEAQDGPQAAQDVPNGGRRWWDPGEGGMFPRLLDYEKLTLRFAPDALEAIADAAIERRVGARGLRMILEELMLDVMYSAPADNRAGEHVITRADVAVLDNTVRQAV